MKIRDRITDLFEIIYIKRTSLILFKNLEDLIIVIVYQIGSFKVER